MASSDLALWGCPPEPLANYLKALGVFRLVAEQKDPEARGFWRNETFHLRSKLDQASLVDFFLNEYQPTPILAPWNGASGFWDRTTAGQALQKVEQSTSPRLETYRLAIGEARKVIARLKLSKKPSKDEKKELLRLCRVNFPEEAVRWLDAAYLLAGEEVKYPPLFGTGGNDGKLDFTSNFIQNILQVIDLAIPPGPGTSTKERGRRAAGNGQKAVRDWLTLALFGSGDAELQESAIGQFHPGGVGGPNAIQGFEGNSLTNPWDFILMLEGALFFVGSVTWRFGAEGTTGAAFPFTVQSTTAGWGSLVEMGQEKGGKARAEMWLPLWEKPASFREVSYLMAEGRAQLGRRQARNGLDFARAVAGLGTDRGIKAFYRYGFLMRSGKAHLATILGRLPVELRPEVGLLEELDPWLTTFRNQVGDDEGSASLRRALRAVEDAIYAYCLYGGAKRIQDILVAVGEAERVVATGAKLREKLRPLPGLSLRWVEAADDGSAEFRLAKALASMSHPIIGPMREYLEPVIWENGRWSWDPAGHKNVWRSGDLSRNLAAVLQRRLLEAGRQGLEDIPLTGRVFPLFRDIQRFLFGEVDGERLGDLLWALAGVNWSELSPDPVWRGEVDEVYGISRAYALLKLVFLPYPLLYDGLVEPVVIRPDATILTRLQAGDLSGAVGMAARTLNAAGVTVLGKKSRNTFFAPDFVIDPREAKNLTAALLLPISVKQAKLLTKIVLRPKEQKIS